MNLRGFRVSDVVRIIRFLLTGSLLSFGVGTVGKAASFDCSKAESETEVAICRDPGLSKLDDVLGELYRLKASINLFGNDLSTSAMYDGFPDFLKRDTKRNKNFMA